MQQDKAVIAPQLIDQLVGLRAQLIEHLEAHVRHAQAAARLCGQIDDLIPTSQRAYPDTMSLIFYSFKAFLGESIQPLPKIHHLAELEPAAVRAAMTRLVDQQLWMMLFNRLNVMSLLSDRARREVLDTVKSAPLEFSRQTAFEVFADIVARRDAILLESLLDVLSSNDRGYASNCRREFRKRTVFREALVFTNNSYFKPNTHGPFRDAVRFLSCVVLGRQQRHTAAGGVKDDVLFAEIAKLFEGYSVTDVGDRKLTFAGGEIRFFNNGNAHLILTPETVQFLNEALAKTKNLYHETSSSNRG